MAANPGDQPSRTISSVQLMWTLFGLMATAIILLATNAWTYQQGQVTAIVAMQVQTSSRVTALEVEVKALQGQYTQIDNKLDQINARLLAEASK